MIKGSISNLWNVFSQMLIKSGIHLEKKLILCLTPYKIPKFNCDKSEMEQSFKCIFKNIKALETMGNLFLYNLRLTTRNKKLINSTIQNFLKFCMANKFYK